MSNLRRVSLRDLEENWLPATPAPICRYNLDARYQPVKKAIAEAESAAVTERDEITVMRLEACDLETTRDRLQSMLRQPPAADVTQEQMEARAKELARLTKLGELTNGKCEALHKALD
jgi:hypothetical protein